MVNVYRHRHFRNREVDIGDQDKGVRLSLVGNWGEAEIIKPKRRAADTGRNRISQRYKPLVGFDQHPEIDGGSTNKSGRNAQTKRGEIRDRVSGNKVEVFG